MGTGGERMSVRFIPEGESRFLTHDALALVYRVCADETLSREVIEGALTEAVRLSLIGDCPVNADLFEVLLQSICERQKAGPKDLPLC
jgi:hypothetical protein